MKKLKVTQIKSVIGATKSQRATMLTLGLRRMHQTVELEEKSEVLGALEKVQHLVKIEK